MTLTAIRDLVMIPTMLIALTISVHGIITGPRPILDLTVWNHVAHGTPLNSR